MASEPGDAFILTGGAVPAPHLWVILWGPAGGADAYLSVMLTTLRAHSDQTCILRPGDHPFVRHDTSVSYANAQRWTDERLEMLLDDGTARPRQPVSGEVLARMRAGFFASPRTPNAFREMAQAEFGAMAPE